MNTDLYALKVFLLRCFRVSTLGSVIKQFAILAVFFFVALGPTLALSSDWNGCANDLDRLRRAARDATDAANSVKSKADDFENCKRYPDMYDLMRDRCRSKASAYQSTLSTLGNELSTVDSRVRSVNSSCGMDLSSSGSSFTRPKTPGFENRMCDLYLGYKNKLPIESLMKTCMQSLSEEECRKCLSQ